MVRDSRDPAGDRHGLDEHLLDVLDSILDLVVIERAVRDESGEIVDFEIEWMNGTSIDAAGRSREALIGSRVSELSPGLADGGLIAGYRRVVETGEPLVVPTLAYDDVIDGRTVSRYYTVQATKFGDGLIVASRDVSELEGSRRTLELALHEIQAAQRLARMGTWQVDLVRQRVTLSEHLCRLCGLPVTSSDIDLSELWGMIPPDDQARVVGAYAHAQMSATPVVVEHRLVRGDGAVVHMSSYAQPVVEDGDVVALWGTMQDISERVASRAALEMEKGRRRAAETVAGLAGTLNGVESPQSASDAFFEAMAAYGTVGIAGVAVVEDDAETLRSYFGGPPVPGPVEARYLRTPLDGDVPTALVARTGIPYFAAEREALAARYPLLVGDAGLLGIESLAVLPLRRAAGALLGALAVGWQEEQQFGDELAEMLAEAATLVARTLERAELVELERSVAHSLQDALLRLEVRTPGVLVRARYRPADASMEVGGDWYDAMDLPEGRVGVAVGDVVGRGLAASTTMGQLRAALGVTALQAPDPARALEVLDRYVQRVSGAACTTVAFAVADPGTGTVTYARAGHPPPLLVSPDGDVRYLTDGGTPPLGTAISSEHRTQAEAPFRPGSLLLLYTDGLIERRGEPLDQGFERLEASVARHWALPIRQLKDAIFGDLVEASMGDDIALLALRTAGASDRVFAEAFRARHDALADVRRRLRDWLDRTGLSTPRRDELLVAVGEAVANAIDHGARGDETQTVRVEGARTDDEIVVSVSDSGRWLPGIHGYFSGRGRGHLLITAFADHVELDTDQHGTTVTLGMNRELART
jgi:PAS domain S-box-containing protein